MRRTAARPEMFTESLQIFTTRKKSFYDSMEDGNPEKAPRPPFFFCSAVEQQDKSSDSQKRRWITVTLKQARFCDEFLECGNATEAAIRAGYSEKSAYSIGEENLRKPELKEYISKQLEAIHSQKTADAQEVMEYLTSVMRGESSSSVLSLCGDGRQKVIPKPPDEKERLKAAELIGRRFGLFKDNLEVGGQVPVVITGGDELEE